MSGIVSKNFWYNAAMKEVRGAAKNGRIQPTISELINVAKLEQLHRIANTLEKEKK